MDFPITLKPAADLVPYERNARTHSQEQIEQIKELIRLVGFTNPILEDAQGIIAGHGRQMAALEMYAAGEVIHGPGKRFELPVGMVPVIDASGMSDAERRAYILADNQVALNAGWDDRLVGLELQTLKGLEFDLSSIGFDDRSLVSFMATTKPEADPEETPEPPSTPTSALGDLWLLGDHRIMCGDSTNADCVEKCMNGKRADLLFTSPPYAHQRDYGAAKESISDWDLLMQGVFSIAPVKDNAQLLVNLGLVHRNGEWVPYWDNWISWMRATNWRRFGWYVWDQGPGLPGDWSGRLAPSHEFVFHFNRETLRVNKTKESKMAGAKLGGGGLRHSDGSIKRKTGHGNAIQSRKIPDSVFRVMRHKGGIGRCGKHPAVFPVALVQEVLDAFSSSGDIIFEPFCGSGTQIIAAEIMARHCFGLDMDPAYVDVAVRRWQDFTGKAATLDGDGRTFAEIAELRSSV